MYKCIRCTDDVALLAEAEKHIKKMMGTLERYLEEKGLEVTQGRRR